MFMLAEVTSGEFDLSMFKNAMNAIGSELGVQVIIQHEDVFPLHAPDLREYHVYPSRRNP